MMEALPLIALMMVAVRISETQVHFKVTTRRHIPEDSKLHTLRRENLKSHTIIFPLDPRAKNSLTLDMTACSQFLLTLTVFIKNDNLAFTIVYAQVKS
jgi:hypothetical protein